MAARLLKVMKPFVNRDRKFRGRKSDEDKTARMFVIGAQAEEKPVRKRKELKIFEFLFLLFFERPKLWVHQGPNKPPLEFKAREEFELKQHIGNF